MYGKIYEQTFTGSMFGKGPTVFAVWSYVIANTKPDSLVELNPAMLAAALGTTPIDIQTAIDFLCAEDSESRSKSFDGRRLIVKGPFIYFVPQAQKYRGLPNDEARRQYFAEKQREHRQRVSVCQTVSSKMSKNVKQAEAEAEAEKEGANGSRPQSLVEPWLKELVADKTYAGIDVRREFGKMLNWCNIRRKQPTKRRFVNWLNNVDRPVTLATPTAPVYGRNRLPPPRDVTEEELARQRKIVREASAKLRDELKK